MRNASIHGAPIHDASLHGASLHGALLHSASLPGASPAATPPRPPRKLSRFFSPLGHFLMVAGWMGTLWAVTPARAWADVLPTDSALTPAARSMPLDAPVGAVSGSFGAQADVLSAAQVEVLSVDAASTELVRLVRVHASLERLLSPTFDGTAGTLHERLNVELNALGHGELSLGELTSEAIRRSDLLTARRRSLERVRPASEYPPPRKRDIAAEGLTARPIQNSDQALEETRLQLSACRQLLYVLGDQASLLSQQPAAFRAYARAIQLDPKHFSAQDEARRSRFFDAAVFMVTTVRRSDEVLELFQFSGLGTEELSRRTVAKMERWLNLYAQAPENITNVMGTRQTLSDMLSLLGEDTALSELLAEKERSRLLALLASVATERGQLAEAIGAYARLNDVPALTRLGRRLSRTVLVETDAMLLVQREVGLATEALAEADDREGLRELLRKSREAQARIKEVRAIHPTRPVVNGDSLDLYVLQLARLVEEGVANASVLEELSKRRAVVAAETGGRSESLEGLTLERLGELIQFYQGQIATQLGDARRVSLEALKSLETEALRREQLELALVAAMSREDAGLTLVALGDRFVHKGSWEQALTAYKQAGMQGIAGLRALGDRLTADRGYLVQGDFNPLIVLAVDAYLTADAVDKLEPLYMDLVQTRAALTRNGDGYARNLTALESCLQQIEVAYELEPQTVKVVAQEPPPMPVEAPKKSASKKSGGKGKR